MPLQVGHFKTRQRPTPDWIIPGFLKRKNTGFIIGEPKKACKSWLLLNLAWDLSEGRPLWNVIHSKEGPVFKPSRPMRVAYFTQEDSEDDIHDRVEILFGAGRQANDNLWVIPKNLQNTLDKGLQSICKELDIVVKESGPIDLVLFDPMRRMHSKEENSSDGMVSIWQSLDFLHQRYNCATIFAHHTVKPGRSMLDTTDLTSPQAARGSGDIFGGGDAFVNVVETKGRGSGRKPGPRSRKHRELTLHFETKRSAGVAPVCIRVNFTSGGVEFAGFDIGRDTENEVEQINFMVQ